MKDFKKKDFKESNEYQMIFRSAETLVFCCLLLFVCCLLFIELLIFLPRLYRILKQFLVQLLSLWGRFHRFVYLTILKKIFFAALWLSMTYCICTMGYVFNLVLINWKNENCGIIFIHWGQCYSPEVLLVHKDFILGITGLLFWNVRWFITL